MCAIEIWKKWLFSNVYMENESRTSRSEKQDVRDSFVMY